MDTPTIIALNIGIATILVAILALLMLSPTRLRQHFSHGYTHRQWRAFHRQHGGATHSDSAASTSRSSPTQEGRNG